jgi:hypothetical protein
MLVACLVPVIPDDTVIVENDDCLRGRSPFNVDCHWMGWRAVNILWTCVQEGVNLDFGWDTTVLRFLCGFSSVSPGKWRCSSLMSWWLFLSKSFPVPFLSVVLCSQYIVQLLSMRQCVSVVTDSQVGGRNGMSRLWQDWQFQSVSRQTWI